MLIDSLTRRRYYLSLGMIPLTRVGACVPSAPVQLILSKLSISIKGISVETVETPLDHALTLDPNILGASSISHSVEKNSKICNTGFHTRFFAGGFLRNSNKLMYVKLTACKPRPSRGSGGMAQ